MKEVIRLGAEQYGRAIPSQIYPTTCFTVIMQSIFFAGDEEEA